MVLRGFINSVLQGPQRNNKSPKVRTPQKHWEQKWKVPLEILRKKGTARNTLEPLEKALWKPIKDSSKPS